MQKGMSLKIEVMKLKLVLSKQWANVVLSSSCKVNSNVLWIYRYQI